MKSNILFIPLIAIILFSCKKDKNTDPALTTNLARVLSASSCYVKATVSEKGSYNILDYGFVYSQSSSSPSIDYETKISLGKTLVADTFSTIFSFDYNSNNTPTFYVRAYLTNTKGTVYGSTLSFKPLLVTVLSVFPITGKVGDSITITGSNFSPNANDNVVKFNTTIAKVLQATTTKLTVAVPSGIQSDYYNSSIEIYVGTVNYLINASSFTLTTTITGFSPKNGTFGTNVTLTGDNLYGASIKLNDDNAQYIYSSSNTSISFSIPNTIKSKKVKIKVVKNYIETLADGYFSMDSLSISAVDPKKGTVGTNISITGVNFNPGYNSNSLKVGGVNVSYTYYNSSTSISGAVPDLSAGTYDVEVNNGISSSILTKAFTIIVPKVTSFSPTSGSYGSEVTILGENLPSDVNVTICSSDNNCNYPNIISRDSSKIVITIPYGITSGKDKLHVSSWIGNLNFADDFTIEPLTTTITSFTPNSGTPGTEVTINGSGFVQGYTDVKFGTVSTTILSITSTVITVQVPSNAGTGAMKISVVISGNTVVSDNNFTIL